ncbi:MAG: DUF2125 domain-containing protein [Alphaproteobacteria bacterium]|nr:DUF2125 domain-containing protein [Alphaproteobacteria bacterium]
MSYAARVLSHRALRRHHLGGLALLFLLIVWALMWGHAAYRLHQAVDALAARSDASFTFRFDSRSTDGTPLTVHVHMYGFEAAFGPDNAIQSDEAVLYLDLLSNRPASLKLKSSIKGKLKGLPFDAAFLKLGLTPPDKPAQSDDDTGLSLWIKASTLMLYPAKHLPLSDMIADLDMSLRVMGTPPDFTQTAQVKSWNEASGIIEIDQLNAQWGPLTLAMKGTLGLSPDLQPEGAFSGRIDGLGEALDELTADGQIGKKQRALLTASMESLARPAFGNASSPIVPVTIQSGGFYLGPVRLFDLPRLNWTPAATEK